MLLENLSLLFARDLDRLQKELQAYQSESTLWETPAQVNNSAGNLCLHLVGNLNHFIGAILGQTGYERKRTEEFGLTNVPRTQLLAQVEATKTMVIKTFATLEEDQLTAVYPIVVFKEEMTTAYFLLHLSTHLNYHLGQITYHRRILENAPI